MKQIGRGLVLWETSISHLIYLYRDGINVDLHTALVGCDIVTNLGGIKICGTDDEGRAWHIQLGDSWKYDMAGIDRDRLFVTRQQVVSLFSGRPFKEVIAECQRAEYEREMEALCRDAEFGKIARKALEEIRAINETGGQGSRVKVRAIVEQLLDGK